MRDSQATLTLNPRVITSERNGSCQVAKRDGRLETYNRQKIVRAVQRCMVNSLGATEVEANDLAADVATGVSNILSARGCDPAIPVEDLQRLVIQQLWASNHIDAAEAYTRYREQRRLEREHCPVTAEEAACIAEDRRHFPTDLQYYQFLSKFARWNDAKGRRETWHEAIFDRVMPWLRRIPGANFTEQEWAEMGSALYNMEAMCSLRVLQCAGPALDRCNMGVYNCTYAPIDDLFAFSELLYILMQGCGAGFSVESDYIDKLPRIKKQRTGRKALLKKCRIDDSTEGWCDALNTGLETWFDGGDVEYDPSGIRPAGARLRTKGGRASGPGPLMDVLNFARATILRKQGGYLEDIDAHDICCMEGRSGQLGGFRRASCISISDLYSTAMRQCKTGNWYDKAKWRVMANNSAAYDETPDAVEFMEEWLSLAKSGSGERGIFNRHAILKNLPARRKRCKFGVNPCGEIILRPRGICNLSIAVARPNDTRESLERKVKIATCFGVLQSLCTNFNYVRSDWKTNAEDERLLGVDITAHADCPLLKYGAAGRSELLRYLREVVHTKRTELATRHNINMSAADTTVKPAGDSAVLVDGGSGISPRFSDYQMRWVRESVHSPLAALLKAEGVEWAVAPEDPALLVFGFPKANPPGSTKRNDLTAIQQLENWLDWKQNWAEHNIAITVYVEPHEWLEVANWVHKHFDQICGVSFLDKDNGIYTYAPNVEITKEDYERRMVAFPKINWAKLKRHEPEDMTTASQQIACTGDRCER